MYLKKAENPLFFYDDDQDGLASYILLSKYIDKGKGIALKSSPVLDNIYLRKIKELSPDYIFILDKPILTQEFVDQVKVPIIWIDHHPVIDIKGVKHYNPRIHDENDNRPTSYWCYQITKQNLWIAMCGIIGDWYVPEYIEDFVKQYPDIIKNYKNPGKILFETEFGKLIRLIGFLLKGNITQIKKNVAVLKKIESPYEILNQTNSRGKFLYKHFEKIEKNYQEIMSIAKKRVTRSKLLIFTYPANRHSLTSFLSNELLHTYPNKIIIIGREKEDQMIMSFRSAKIKVLPILEKALIGINGHGGGHDHACGGGVAIEQFDEFIENFKKAMK